MNKALIATLYENPVYAKLLEEVKGHRPLVPAYDWRTDNRNEIVAKLCEQKGFDFVMSIITIGDQK